MSPHDIGVRWLFTLTDPLIPLTRREHLTDQMTALIASRPRWGCFFLAGILCDLMETLPDEDSWRLLSGRWGQTTFGPNPPQEPGATSSSGAAFGTYADAIDVTGQVMAHAEIDTGLVAFAAPLDPAAAFAVATATLGHERAPEALAALVETGAGEDDHVAAVIQIGSRRRLPSGAGRPLAEAGLEAVRWMAARRRSYLATTDDGYLVEVVSRWSALAARWSEGEDLQDRWPMVHERNKANGIDAAPF